MESTTIRWTRMGIWVSRTIRLRRLWMKNLLVTTCMLTPILQKMDNNAGPLHSELKIQWPAVQANLQLNWRSVLTVIQTQGEQPHFFVVRQRICTTQGRDVVHIAPRASDRQTQIPRLVAAHHDHSAKVHRTCPFSNTLDLSVLQDSVCPRRQINYDRHRQSVSA